MLVAVTSGRRNTTASFIAQHFWDIGLVVDRFDNFEFFTECTFLKMGVLLYALRLLLFIAFFFLLTLDFSIIVMFLAMST